jgi:hypothetical protein
MFSAIVILNKIVALLDGIVQIKMGATDSFAPRYYFTSPFAIITSYW